jgi:hypothetical protein
MTIQDTINEINDIIAELSNVAQFPNTNAGREVRKSMDDRIARLRDKNTFVPADIPALTDDLNDLQAKAVLGEEPPLAPAPVGQAIVGLG